MSYATEQRFSELLADLAALHVRKSHDYGDEQTDNLHAARSLGLSPYLGVLLRMNDKMSRLCALARREHLPLVREETVVDTLKDLCVYSLLAIILREEEQGEVDQ